MTLKLETLLLRAHYAAYSWGYEAGSKGSCLDTGHAADKAATLAKELRDALASTGAATPPADALQIPFNDETKYILGLMCFQVARFAHAFKAAGADIASKAEAEQAFILHKFLNLYLKHGEAWRTFADAEIRAALSAINETGVKS